MENKPISMGEQLRHIRKLKGLSQVQLAKNAGLAQSFVSTIENDRKSPTIRSMQKLANALDISPKELIYLCIEKGEEKSL